MRTRRNFLHASLGLTATLYAQGARSPITNRWGEAKTTLLELPEIVVFKAPPEADYNHHQQVVFDRGRLYASWSNGIAHEDHPGQKMVFATSTDLGDTWSEPSIITPAAPFQSSAFTAMGITIHRQELHAYYGHYAWNDLAFNKDRSRIVENGRSFRDKPAPVAHHDIYSEVRVSPDRGSQWGPPIRILDNFVPNLRPFPVASGRLIMPGNVTFPHTDDRAGLSGWKHAGIPRLPSWTVDDSEGLHNVCTARGDKLDYCEGSFYQTDDHRIHLMLRTLPLAGEKHSGLLAVTESDDNGDTWSEPRLTAYTDCSCRFQFGRLPDGRFFGLSCPEPGSPRAPLVLALSRDGVVFDRHYILGNLGRTKSRLAGRTIGTYGYPSCDVADGKMFIIFSRSKEDIHFCSLNLKALV
jgi:hypothetical protein